MKALIAVAAAISLLAEWTTAAAQPRPNIVVIVADDMGYSDAGCYGGEIQTPNLDRLAAGGLRFTQFYNTARCWPTRASILTGYYPQQVRRDALPDMEGGASGHRPPWAQLLPQLLGPLGYRSYHSGKWHVDGKVLEGGFVASYSLNDHDRNFNPKQHTLNDVPLPEVKTNSGYYSTTAIAQHAIEMLADHQQRHPDRPFFLYLAFTSPHFPLHALPQDYAIYANRYSNGWDTLREERIARMTRMGLVRCELPPLESRTAPSWNLAQESLFREIGRGEAPRAVPWNRLSLEQRQFQPGKMALHAAMIHRMDLEIGRVLAQVKAMGAFDNTLILFLSDNGASAEQIIRGDGHDRNAPPGSSATFLCLGPGWSSAANTPFRLHKSWVHEGGISTPLIVHWPKGIRSRGELRHNPGHVIDLAPTLLELAGGRWPETFQGRPVPPPPGKSLVPLFKKDGLVAHDYFWWYHDGNRAIRVGDWKLVADHQNGWELYDLRSDRSEAINLATNKPEKVQELDRAWTLRAEQFRATASTLPGEGTASTSAVSKPKPNILFFLTDDQRYDTISALGNKHVRTPALDRLCRDGFVFTRAYIMGAMQGAVCVPSRAMLLTGRSLFRVEESLAGQTTWPEKFAEAGYKTFITGKWHNQPQSLRRVFQEGKAVFLGGMGDPFHLPVEDLSPGQGLVNRRTNQQHSVQQFADAAIDFLARQKPGQPFLCYVALNGPHDPRVAPELFRQLYASRPPPLPPNYLPFHRYDIGDMAVRDELLAPWPRPPEVVRQHLADYYSYVSFIDAQIDRVLKALKEYDLDQNTLVVFTADNGLAIGSHGLFGKQNLYEHSVHQPLVFSGPGIPKGKTSEALCYLFDVFPTLGDWCGISGPDGSEGLSLAPILRSATRGERDAIFTAYRQSQRAIRDQGWKLIVYPQINRTQLFDLRHDPYETRNLAGEAKYVDAISRLTALMTKFQAEFGDSLALSVANPKAAEFDYQRAEKSRNTTAK